MYILGAYIISHYSNMSYPDFVQERILTPLNMSGTTFWPSAAETSRRLTHTWDKDGRRIPFWVSDDAADVEKRHHIRVNIVVP